MDPHHKVAIVTGAGSGIGKAVALALLKEGYSVALAGRRKDRLEQAVNESGAGLRALAIPTDVGNPEAVRALFSKTKEAFGRLDLLFNNAGAFTPATPTEDIDYETWKAAVDTNLTGTFLCTQQAIKLMKTQDPRGVAAVYTEGEGADVESALLAMGRATADAIPKTGPEPNGIAFIPGRDHGLIDGSIRFLRSHVLLNQRFFIAHQNILNLNRDTEALLAQYLRKNQKTHFLLIRYPDGKAAEEAYRGFMKAYLPDAGGKNRWKTEDRLWTLVEKKNELLLIVFGAPTEADAEAMIKAAKEKLDK